MESNIYNNYTPVDYVIAYTIGESFTFEKKIALLNAVVPIINDPILNKVLEVIQKTQAIPTIESIVNSIGYAGSFPQLKDDLNIADFLVIIENHDLNIKKVELSRRFIEISKDIANLSRTEILRKVSDVVSRIEVIRDEKEFNYREAYYRKKEEPAGYLTFVKPLDDSMRGVAFGTMWCVAGFAGQGKTTFGVSTSYGNKIKCGLNGVVISFEMPKGLLYSYYYSRHSYDDKFRSIHKPVSKEKLLFATMNPEEEKYILGNVYEDFHENPEYGKLEILDISDFESTSFSGIQSRLARVPFQIHYLLVDYAQKFKFIAPSGMEEPANRYVAFFNNLCMNFNGTKFSLIMLSQTNREWYNIVRKPGRDGVEGAYPLTALAEINALERDSTYVSFLYSNDVLKERNELMLNLPKNRYLTTFETPIYTHFNPAYCVVGDEIRGLGETRDSVDLVSTFLGGTLFGG